MVLHLISETDELLRRSGAWKINRRVEVPENREGVLLEGIDIFKILMSVMQLWGVTEEEFYDAYWRKSMAVRQRYSEEFVKSLSGPTVLIDIDGVLADWHEGFARFMERNRGTSSTFDEIITWIRRDRPRRVQDAIEPTVWKTLKHRFRTEGHKALLPLMPGAKELLWWCHLYGYLIVLVTSRPISEYPNLYTDTLMWLHNHDMPFDFIWWATDKGGMAVEKGIKENVVFAVDDDPQFCRSFALNGIKTYWFGGDDPYRLTDMAGRRMPNIEQVSTLADIIKREAEHELQRQRTSATRDALRGDATEPHSGRAGGD